MTTNFLRGQIYAATLPGMTAEKYYVVVSNNGRNRSLGTALVARITTSDKPELASIVRVPFGEPVSGRVLCDDIEDIWEDDVRSLLGAFSPATMRLVDAGLAAALGLG
ncbi:type II toxin-antitoxin system PemK/MazF family toxin [Rhodoglobus aureus]|uniref:Type II toxin-antitoxin system PemK/MazF family toxin n=1 Tax=Rhodoglobus aureus TaxID=191497 RepID=A0ABP4G4T7_9MICO